MRYFFFLWLSFLFEMKMITDTLAVKRIITSLSLSYFNLVLAMIKVRTAACLGGNWNWNNTICIFEQIHVRYNIIGCLRSEMSPSRNLIRKHYDVFVNRFPIIFQNILRNKWIVNFRQTEVAVLCSIVWDYLLTTSFSITGDMHCTSSSLIYHIMIYATGRKNQQTNDVVKWSLTDHFYLMTKY